MNKLLTAFIAFTLVGPALAQQKADEHSSHHGATAAIPSTDMTDGEIRRIDKDGGKVTIRHAEIKSLDMPAMTMVFQIKDRTKLDKLQAGDKVKFKAISEGGTLTVTEIEPVR